MKLQSIAAACVFAGAASVALAQTPESEYARVGKWSVVTARTTSGGFFYCGATINNGKADLRIATDGRDWEVGTRYRGQGTVEVYYGFGVAGEVATLEADGDGWISMRIDRDQLNAYRSLPSFSLNIGRNEQTWALAGAPAALDKAMECARQRGGAKAAAPAPAAPAQPIGKARPFGAGFDGWSFTATTEKPGLVNCRAIRKVGGREDIMAMRTDNGQYVSVKGDGRHGKWDGMRVISGGGKSREWRVPSEADGLRMWFTMPNVSAIDEISAAGSYRYATPDGREAGSVPLGGRSADAWTRVKQCINANR